MLRAVRLSEIPVPIPIPEEPPRQVIPRRRRRPWVGWLVGGLAMGAGAAVVAGVAVWWFLGRPPPVSSATLQETRAQASTQFGPALAHLTPGTSAGDLDGAVAFAALIDEALADGRSLQEILDRVARAELNEVDPALVVQRRVWLEAVQALYGGQVDGAGQREALGLVAALRGAVPPPAAVGGAEVGPIDRDALRAALEEAASALGPRSRAAADARAQADTLIAATVADAEAFAAVWGAWDRLCVARERAWSAAREGDWDGAIAAADDAVRRAPLEQEAHLLSAYARIRRGSADDFAVARLRLDRFRADHPGADAPAVMLLGALAYANGEDEAAEAWFAESAALYAAQRVTLDALTWAYAQRATRPDRGSAAAWLDDRRALATGGGPFAPAVQRAAALARRGEVDDAVGELSAHFVGRRERGEWALLLEAFRAANALAGPVVRAMIPEASFVRLGAQPTLDGDGLAVSLDNGTYRAWSEVSLVVCVRRVGQPADRCEAVPAPVDRVTLDPYATTPMGILRIDPDEVAGVRGVLVTPTGARWLDTPSAREAELAALRSGRERGPLLPVQRAPWFQEWTAAWRSDSFDAGRDATARTVEAVQGADGLEVRMPITVARYAPAFALRFGERLVEPAVVALEADGVRVQFRDLGVLGDPAVPLPQIGFVQSTAFGDWTYEISRSRDGLQLTEPRTDAERERDARALGERRATPPASEATRRRRRPAPVAPEAPTGTAPPPASTPPAPAPGG